MAWSNAALRRQHSRVVNNESEELPNQSPHFPSLMDFLILWKAYSSPKRITSGLPSPGSNRDHFPYADFTNPDKPARITCGLPTTRSEPHLYASQNPVCAGRGNSQAPNCYGCFSSRNVNIAEARSTGFSIKDKCPEGISALFAVGIKSASS